MTVSVLHGLYGVTIDPDSFIAVTTLGAITRQGLRVENKIDTLPTSGEQWARFQALHGQKYSAMFETLQLKTALDACGVSGLGIAATVRTGLRLYAQSFQEGGTRKAGANHDSWTIREGILFPTSLTCQFQDDAKLSYDALATYDGTNDPVVIAKDVLLPAALLTDALRYTIGPITLGGLVFDHCRSVEINFGLQGVTEGADSDIWDTFAWFENVLPSITIKGVKKRWIDATGVPITGLAMTHANSSIFFRKRALGGMFVANAVAEHVKFTFCGMCVPQTIFDAAENRPGEVDVMIPLRYDGNDTPLKVNTAIIIA